MSEVFSAENYVANVIWVKNFSPKNTAKYFSVDHDYLIVFANNKTIWLPHLLPRSTEADPPKQMIGTQIKTMIREAIGRPVT
jgi:adenine-specific DNA-methyltransferase